MQEKRKIPFDILDSIRGIAALYVAIGHCRGTLWMGGSEFIKRFPRETWDTWDYIVFGSSMLTRLSVEFVIVFFVLSGFSIAHSLSGSSSASQFYKRRFIRIYPSYLAALIWAGLIFVITKAIFPEWYNGSYTEFAYVRTVQMNDYFEPGRLIKNLFYMPGQGFITPFWSLTYEIIFYLLAPLIMKIFRFYAPVSILLFLVNLISPGMVSSLHLPLYIHEFIFVYNIYFVIGIALYRNLGHISAIFSTWKKSTILLCILAVAGLMYAVNIYLQTETVYSFMVAAVLSCLLIIFFINHSIRIGWLMNVGKFSYTLYITHLASIYLYLCIFTLMFNPTLPYIVNYFVWMPAVLFCVLFAYLQYLAVEGPTKKILNLLRSRQKTVEPITPVVRD